MTFWEGNIVFCLLEHVSYNISFVLCGRALTMGLKSARYIIVNLVANVILVVNFCTLHLQNLLKAFYDYINAKNFNYVHIL